MGGLAIRPRQRLRYRLIAVTVIVVSAVTWRAGALGCVGDCRGQGAVDIADLIVGVNIVLGSASVSDCEAFANRDGRVDIVQLVQGVNNALNGCVMPTVKMTSVPTKTPASIIATATPTPPNTETATNTPTMPKDRFVDNADGTTTDRQTGLTWEKKVGLDNTADAADLHDADDFYNWAGQCSLATDILCQPNAAAAAACAQGTQGEQIACAECGPGQGTCNLAGFYGLTTIWDWVAQLDAVNFAGHRDWRVPTVAELESIIDYTAHGSAKTDRAFKGTSCGAECTDLTSAACSCTADIYWSATTYSGSPLCVFDPGCAWSASFLDGFVLADPGHRANGVRAVRSSLPNPVPRYVENGDGTISDHQTGLMWEKKVGSDGGAKAASLHDSGNTYSWSGECSIPDMGCQPNAAAAAACAQGAQVDRSSCAECQASQGTCNVDPAGVGAITTIWDWVAQLDAMKFAGYGDWRVPTISELESIVDYAAKNPAIDGTFNGASCGTACTDVASVACSCTQASIYWSATVNSDGLAWIVSFNRGDVANEFRGENRYVRAVRGSW